MNKNRGMRERNVVAAAVTVFTATLGGLASFADAQPPQPKPVRQVREGDVAPEKSPPKKGPPGKGPPSRGAAAMQTVDAFVARLMVLDQNGDQRLQVSEVIDPRLASLVKRANTDNDDTVTVDELKAFYSRSVAK